MKEVVIVSACRTAIGSFMGGLSSISATRLGGLAIAAAVKRAGVDPGQVEEVIMGNVLSAGLGQAPATQASIYAGLPDNIPSTSVNKVCASGMKAAMLAAQSIGGGGQDVVACGGMESMSNVPYYISKARSGYRFGNGELTDGMIKDGLWDVYNDFHMGSAADNCAVEHGISREMQDAYAAQSYTRAQSSIKNGLFKSEIVPVEVASKSGTVQIMEDEEPAFVKFEKIPNLKAAFGEGGTVTAANASNLNDGAAALVLMSAEKATELGVRPLFRMLGWADAQQAPGRFTTSPSLAIPLALKKAGLSQRDISFYEINEAFSVVSIANNALLGLSESQVNINGGAVALGHPLGASGARIMVSLMSVLAQQGARYGVASICNGGGGASAVVIENIASVE